MAKAFSHWTVLPHEPILKLSENLRWVRGDLPGMSLKRVMTVARRVDGQLVIHNPIALEPDAQSELEAFGEPGFLVVPNGWHRLDAPSYKQRYPKLQVFAPRGSKSKVEEVIGVDGTFEDFPSDARVSLETLKGTADAEGVMRVRDTDGTTLVFGDAVFNMDRKRDLVGRLFTGIFASAPGPRVSRLAKLAFIKDKAALKQELLRYAQIPDLKRVIVAHEKVSEGVAAQVTLVKAAEYL